MKLFFARLMFLSLILSLAGCGKAVDPVTVALRKQLLVSEPLAGEKTISDVRKELKSESLTSSDSFVVRVRINAGDFPPFADGMAAFVVTDATGHDGDEAHNPHECPFCKRDIKNSIARVEFADADGKLIKIDSRELFDIEEFDLLVIEGTGRFDEDDTLIIAAKTMFVKR
jgi:hypothetical protein